MFSTISPSSPVSLGIKAFSTSNRLGNYRSWSPSARYLADRDCKGLFSPMVQDPKNGKKDNNEDVVDAMQTFIKAGVIKIGATGLEPATS